MSLNEDWLKQQSSILESLEGKIIVNAQGRREALDWEDEDETIPIFNHPDLPFSQMSKIEVETSDKCYYVLTTSQNDDVFGISINRNKKTSLKTEDSSLIELPNLCGKVSGISHSTKWSSIREATIEVGGVSCILVAGEVEPGWNDLTIREMDESILVFKNRDDLEKLYIWKAFTNPAQEDLVK